MPATAAPLDLQKLRALLRIAEDASARSEERAKATHARFNVFTTLLPVGDEVRLHTRFLHCLLDPEGPHDCGSLFLDLFLKALEDSKDTNGNHFQYPPDCIWKVEKEAFVGDEGKIDLLIETNGCRIAIENKIHAQEQDRQLARYASHVSRSGRNGYVFYLTLDGKTSHTSEGCAYIRISYRDQILPWLNQCLRETFQQIPVNQVLLQYREVVRQLVGQSFDRIAMDPIVSFIQENPEFLRHRSQIDAAVIATRAAFLDRLADGIVTALGPELEARPRSGLNGTFGSDRYGALIITPSVSSPLRYAPFEVWVEHIGHLQDALIVGIESRFEKPAMTPETATLLGDMDRLLAEYEAKTGWNKASPRSTWSKNYWPTGSHDLIHPFDDAELANRLEKDLNDSVQEVCVGIRSHIELLERLYVEALGNRSTAVQR